MSRKPTQSHDDSEQSKRFVNMAREVGADREDVLNRVLKKITSEKGQKNRDIVPPKRKKT